MGNKTFIVLLAGCLVMLSSCVTIKRSWPTAEALSAAKFPPPTPEESLAAITSLIYSSGYKDPDSALFRDVQVLDFGAIDLAQPTGAVFGYRISLNMNIKNGSGAYNGYLRYTYLVTQSGRAIELMGNRLNTVTFQHVPELNRYFYTEAEMRANAPPSI
jgi:hypothetical protein